jgi:hypothetical protein
VLCAENGITTTLPRPTETPHSITNIRQSGWLSVMPVGTSKVSTKSTKTSIRPKVYPVAGFVTFNWRVSAIGNAVAHFQASTVRLTRRDVEKLNLAQLIGNRRGFVVALVCPQDGTVVQTSRGSDLPDGVLAKCPLVDCGKEWVLDD